ncbi:MAG: PKD domain-containing protein [Thermoplasmata archaeon]
MVLVKRLNRSGPASRDISGMRALTKPLAVVILAVVVVVAGAGTFAAFAHPATACAPADNPVCIPSSTNPYDLSVLVPLRTTQEDTPIPVTAILPSQEHASSFTFNFGDGTVNTTTSPTLDHSYSSAGDYIISVSALVNGVVHSNAHALATVSVATSYATDSLGTFPTTLGSILSNSTSTANPTTLLQVGQSLTFQGMYTLPPTNPLYSLTTPTVVSPGGTVSGATNTSQTAQATFTYAKPGAYEVSFVGAGAATGNPTAYANYTYTVEVAAAGQNYGFAGSSTTVDPHPGQIIAYEAYSGGATTFDPAIDYDLAGYEVVGNVYQTLIAYNGSAAGPDANSYVPMIATCVPGSAQCTALYGNDLQQGDNYTFVISSTPQFYDYYDTVNGVHPSWGVYPSDVMFSVLRTMGFSLLPYPFFTNGWILTQSLLPGGNGTWDDGLHATFNNTPQQMFAAMTINGTDCPTVAMTQEHGCITFNANASNSYGSSWPFFLELISDEQGGSVVPCGWFSMPSQGQGIPGWTATNTLDQGPHPCRAPTPAQISAMAPTSFDSWEQNYYNAVTGVYAGNTQWRTVGSGPYYLSQFTLGESYGLGANPAYQASPTCTWSACQPAAGDYVPVVHVTWESDTTLGEESMASGVADFASFPATDTGFLLSLIQEGKANAVVVPSLAINTLFFALNFSVSAAKAYTSNPVDIPSNFFSYLGMRQFLIHAYPYASVESTVNTIDGIQYAFDFGGAIPDFMGNYYPHNIAWPTGNPCTNATDPSCPAYWWAAMNDPTGPYYDPQAASCTSAKPCTFSIYNSEGDTAEDERMELFAASVSSVSGGAISMTVVDIPATTLALEGTAGPGTNALPMETGVWYPDYPDPTDYVAPFYYPDATFSLPESTAEGLLSSLVDTPTPNAYNSTLPSGAACPTDYNFYVNISAAGYAVVPQSCQGAAYDAMIGLMTLAGALPANGLRVLEFDQAETIANQLGLMISEYQDDLVIPYAAWVHPDSISTNVIYAGFYWWWLVNGNGMLSSS